MRFGLGTVFTVTNTRDRGRGSLRTAIRRANRRRRTAVRIEFAIGSGPVTICPLSPLPPITFTGTVDGWTQPGFTDKPLVELCGTSAESGVGLEIAASGVTVRGLVITGWTEDGIFVHDCDDVRLGGLHLGVDHSGTTALGNAGSGVRALNADHCTVGGTGPMSIVSSGNGVNGVLLVDCRQAQVTGAFLGTDWRGRVAVPNSESGIRLVNSPRAMIGGEQEGLRNVVSGNALHGVSIVGAGSGGAVVIGNRLGTDLSGRIAIPNTAGIAIWEAPDVRIGGPSAGEGNLASGNLKYGVLVGGERARRTSVMGNRVGTDVTGEAALPNGHSGVVFQSAPEPQIGGALPGEGNLVSGNGRYGIEVTRPQSSGAVILGNYVGTDRSGQRAIPNGRSGILVYNTSDVRIGGVAPGEGNVISGGARAGINLDGSAIVETEFAGKGNARRNLVRGNLIGVDSTGEAPLGNQLRGILIYESHDNVISDNVISANGEDGILILGPLDDSDPNLVPSGNRILRNRIGVTRSGAPAGNGRHGVFVRHAKKNEIGGDTEDDGNVIANNQGRGIQFTGVGARTNFVSPHNKVADNAKGSFHQPSEDAPTAPSDRPAPGP